MAAVRRRGGRVWTPPQITNKEHRTTLRISLQKIVPHRARASLRLLQRPCGSAPSFQRAPPPLLQQQMRSKGLGGRSEDSLALGKKKGKQGKKKKSLVEEEEDEDARRHHHGLWHRRKKFITYSSYAFPDDAVLTRQLPAFVVVDVIAREIRN